MKSAADLDLRRISRKAGNCLYFPVCHPALVSLLVRSPHFKFLYIIPVTVMMMVMMVRMMMMMVMMMMMMMMVVMMMTNSKSPCR